MRPRLRHPVGMVWGFVALLGLVGCAVGGDDASHPVEAADPWTRVPAVAGPDAAIAVYMTLTNSGPEPLVLTGITSPAAQSGMLHETVLVADLARMREVASVPLLPGTPVALRPGSIHGMLRGVDPAPEAGRTIPVTLHFQDGSNLSLSVPIRAR